MTLALPILLALALPAPPQEQDSSPRIELEALSGTRTTRDTAARPVRSLSKEGAAFAHFLDVERPDTAERSPRELAKRATLELTGGDRLAAYVVGGDGDVLQLELGGGVPLSLSIDGIRSILFAGRIPDSVTTAPSGGDDGDRLYLLAPGGSLDRAEGFVEAFTGEGVTFEDARVGRRTFAWDRVVALFVTALDAEPSDPDAEPTQLDRVSVSLIGGGRLSGELVKIGSIDEGVTLKLGDAANVVLPGRLVTEVALDDGSFRFLGDLPPSDRGSASPFGDDLGFTWPMRVDRNCRGGLLRVGGVEFDRGLGVHAPSRITWTLDGEWKELRLACGIDESGAEGSRVGTARFRVLADGRELWESDVLRAGSAAVRPKPLRLAGVKSLVLEVDPAGDFVLDRANWLRPMLIR